MGCLHVSGRRRRDGDVVIESLCQSVDGYLQQHSLFVRGMVGFMRCCVICASGIHLLKEEVDLVFNHVEAVLACMVHDEDLLTYADGVLL
jgi:hypothetical protein